MYPWGGRTRSMNGMQLALGCPTQCGAGARKPLAVGRPAEPEQNINLKAMHMAGLYHRPQAWRVALPQGRRTCCWSGGSVRPLLVCTRTYARQHSRFNGRIGTNPGVAKASNEKLKAAYTAVAEAEKPGRSSSPTRDEFGMLAGLLLLGATLPAATYPMPRNGLPHAWTLLERGSFPHADGMGDVSPLFRHALYEMRHE